MKVFELISLLNDYCEPNALVETEGCDCLGKASGVLTQENGTVLITRVGSEWSDSEILPPIKSEYKSEWPSPPGLDGTPGWAYDEDGYCVCCGNGKWKYHMPECELRDALDVVSQGREER